MLADHFFTSMFGPTFPEHLYTVAAQSNGIVDNKSTTDHPGQLLRRPHRVHAAFPRGPHERRTKKIMKLEENYTNDLPNLLQINPFWENIRTCINIKTLPDQLEKAGIDWKYYANDRPMDECVAGDPARAVRPRMWAKVQPPERSSSRT